MLWLACDTSTASGSLALFDHSKHLDQISWLKEGSHSESITSAFLTLLNKHSLKPNDLHFVATGVGPGSFTGIRVSVNFARALAQALEKPVLAINSLHLLALQPRLKSVGRVRVIQYAFRNLFYTSEYLIENIVRETEAPNCKTAIEIASLVNEKTLVIGTGYDKISGFVGLSSPLQALRNDQYSDLPQAQFFATLVEQDNYRDHLTDWIHTIPLYIRASEAEEKMKAGLLKPLA